MKQKAPWVPIAKNAVKLLPNNRRFTELEALYSLQLNHNNGDTVTARGLAGRWGWGRKKVRLFLLKLGVNIVYPKNTMEVTKQRGLINLVEKETRKGPERDHINFIDFNKLQTERDQKGGQKGATINEKEKENNPHTSFKDDIPHEKVVSLYHEILPELARVMKWTKQRHSLLRARWKEEPKRQTLDWWRGYFDHVRKSKFLMGENGHFQANLEWLIRPNNLLKVIEGNYHR